MRDICFNDSRGYGGSHRDGVEDHASYTEYIYAKAILVGQGGALTELRAHRHLH